MNAAFTLALLAFVQPPAFTPAPPVIPDRTFSLAAYAPPSDGKSPSTDAFKRAIAAVDQAGGGTLEVPAGVYLTGPLRLGSRINLHLDAGALIRFSDRASDYSGKGRRLDPQLSITNQHDVEISGAGTIDGQGGTWWPAANAMRDPVTGRQFNGSTSPRPAMVVFSGCQRIRVEGVTLRNSPALNLGINGGEDSVIDGITILNPEDSPNTDGIDPKGAVRVFITRCHIDTGDDNIAAGGNGRTPEHDILITDCQFLHGHGCSIGSGTAGGVRNFTVRHCTFDGTYTGIRLKSARGRGGLTENLLYEDLTMRHVDYAFSLNSNYQGTMTDEAVLDHAALEPVTRGTPQWQGIVVRNVTATGCTKSAGLLVGLPEMPVEDVLFDHVRIEAPAGMRLGYASNITFRDSQIVVQHGEPLMPSDTVKGLVR